MRIGERLANRSNQPKVWPSLSISPMLCLLLLLLIISPGCLHSHHSTQPQGPSHHPIIEKGGEKGERESEGDRGGPEIQNQAKFEKQPQVEQKHEEKHNAQAEEKSQPQSKEEGKGQPPQNGEKSSPEEKTPQAQEETPQAQEKAPPQATQAESSLDEKDSALPAAALPVSASPPEWINQKPAWQDGCLTLVGASEDCPDEQTSRVKAMEDAKARIVDYVSGLVRAKFERLAASDHLPGKFIDPNRDSSSFREFFSSAIAKRVKGSKIYEENQTRPSGEVVYRSFVLISMPQGVIEHLMKNFAAYRSIQAQNEARQQTNKVARRQAQKAAEFWKHLDLGPLYP
ncbi:MAG: hypothetical protein K6U11_10775 [bacterium]|nr:hypothetical protein [bacterium]